jgi:uncharacterized protein YndB with AHSA1/START domain
MRIVKRILIGLVVIVGVLVAIAYVLPREVSVERSTTIDAPPEKIFTVVNGYKRFNEWSPWYELDPGMAITHEGPEEGVGAKMTWKSDKSNVGSGTQEIIESVPNEKVRVALDFGKNGKGVAGFTLVPEGEGTKVTWDFETDLGNNPVARYFGLMFDRWIGPDYEKGLAKLKALVEAS